MIMQTEITL